jgi:hypothetical protein
MRGRLLNLLSLLFLAAAVAYLLHGIFGYALADAPEGNGAFSLLRSWRIPSFYDLRWNLAITECNDIAFSVLTTTDRKCNGFPWVGYPPLSLLLGKWLGFGSDDRSGIAVRNQASWATMGCWPWDM